jgi:hypothetical protein
MLCRETDFLSIQRYFHINNPEKDPTRISDREKSKSSLEKNPLYKVQPLLEAIRNKSQEHYNLSQHVSVDEAIIKFMGQHWCVVGAPQRGFEIFSICDASSGFLTDFQLYHRRKKEEGLTKRVVEQLCENLYECYHVIYVDKLYTGLSLLGNGTYMCGSFHAGRRHWPTDLKPNKKVSKKNDPVQSLKRGQSLARQSKCGKLNACVWQDSALVMNLSTCYTPSANSRKDTVTRKIRNAETGNWETVALACPVPIQEYNKYMGGVEQHDHLRSSYSLQRMSSKWWLYFAWFGIDVALINA